MIKKDILIARHGGGVAPDYLLHLDLRVNESKRTGKKSVKQLKLMTVLELQFHGSERLLNEKLLELEAGLNDANEQLMNVQIDPVMVVVDASENPIYKPPAQATKYQVIVGSNITNRYQAGCIQVSRSVMMNAIKPYFDVALESGQSPKILFMDKSEMGLALQHAVKEASLKPMRQSEDEFSVQAESKQEALALLGCLGIYAAVQNIGFAGGGSEIEYPGNW